jgi:hypothetical protein
MESGFDIPQPRWGPCPCMSRALCLPEDRDNLALRGLMCSALRVLWARLEEQGAELPTAQFARALQV